MNEELDLQRRSVFDIDMETTLELIRRAIAGEARDEKFYNYLISVAPNQKEKDIIRSIRDDELSHFDLFKQVYKDIAHREPVPLEEEEYEQPESYLDGIEEALFGELDAVELYRQIYYGLRKDEHRDKLFEIITDELKHSGKYNFIYTRNYSANVST